EEQALAAGVDAAIARLPLDRRNAVLDAILLEQPADLALLPGETARTITADLAALGMGPSGSGTVRDILRERLRREEGPAHVRSRAEARAGRRASAGAWDGARGGLAAHAKGKALGAIRAQALRARPPLAPDRAQRWIERVDDHEAAEDPDLALARATF